MEAICFCCLVWFLTARPDGQFFHNPSLFLRTEQKKAFKNVPFDLQNPTQAEPLPPAQTSDYWRSEASEKVGFEIGTKHIHSSKEWLKCFEEASRNPNMHRRLRCIVQISTINSILRGKYYLEDGKSVNLDKREILRAAQDTKFYHNDYQYKNFPSKETSTKILIIEGDCIEAAYWLRETYKVKPVVLNMASAVNPGGGYRKGSGAQEENLHRRSVLFHCLEDPYGVVPNRQWSYPLPDFGGLYTPNALVIRSSESTGYAYLDNPKRMSFIAVAAYRGPPLEEVNGEMVIASKKIVAGTKRKIATILNMALENGHDSVVLSALGCGAYGNPPKHIAQLFKQVIEAEFQAKFKVLAFAIIDDHNAHKAHNPEGNIKPFGQVFGSEVLQLEALQAQLANSKASPNTSASAEDPSTSD